MPQEVGDIDDVSSPPPIRANTIESTTIQPIGASIGETNNGTPTDIFTSQQDTTGPGNYVLPENFVSKAQNGKETKSNKVLCFSRENFFVFVVVTVIILFASAIGLGIGLANSSRRTPTNVSSITTSVPPPDIWDINMALFFLCGDITSGEDLSLDQKNYLEQALVMYGNEVNKDVNFTSANVLQFQQSECCEAGGDIGCFDESELIKTRSTVQFALSGKCTISCENDALPVEDSVNRMLQIGLNRSRFVEILQTLPFTFDTVNRAEVISQELVDCTVGNDRCDNDGVCCGTPGCNCTSLSNSLCNSNNCIVGDDFGCCEYRRGHNSDCLFGDFCYCHQFDCRTTSYRNCCPFDFCPQDSDLCKCQECSLDSPVSCCNIDRAYESFCGGSESNICNAPPPIENHTWTIVGDPIWGDESHSTSGWTADINYDGTVVVVGDRTTGARVFALVDGEWSQRGASFTSNAFSISNDGSVIAFNVIGGAKVYEWNNEGWTQLGDDIQDISEYGSIIALSGNGKSLIIGNGNKVHDWNGKFWSSPRVLNDDIGRFGASVSITDDGNVIAFDKSDSIDDILLSYDYSSNVGGRFSETGDSGSDYPTVYIYEWKNTAWVRRGNEIVGSNNDFARSGQAPLALSSLEGNVIVISAHYFNAGTVYVYEFDGSRWNLRGDVFRGEWWDGAYYYGETVSISSDGSTILAGAEDHGFAHVFKWDGQKWIQKGGSIYEASIDYSVISGDGTTAILGFPSLGSGFTSIGVAEVWM